MMQYFPLFKDRKFSSILSRAGLAALLLTLTFAVSQRAVADEVIDQVSAGEVHTCAIDDSGVACRGDNDNGPVDVLPSGNIGTPEALSGAVLAVLGGALVGVVIGPLLMAAGIITIPVFGLGFLFIGAGILATIFMPLVAVGYAVQGFEAEMKAPGSYIDSVRDYLRVNDLDTEIEAERAEFALLPVLSIADTSVKRGERATLTLNLSKPSAETLTVGYYTTDGSAISGTDYTGTAGIGETLTFEPGVTSQTITLETLGEADSSEHKDFTVELYITGFGGYSFAGEGQSAMVTISNRDFTKLDSNGDLLANQELDYATQPWEVVVDNDTGLVWEVKANDGQLRDKGWHYTWYNADSTTNGGDAGYADSGQFLGTDNCYDNTRCDTQQYVADVNAGALGGFDDWRLPTVGELKSLVDLNQPAAPYIDTAYFPNTVDSTVWSVSADENNSLNAAELNFDDGKAGTAAKALGRSVRLVRGEQKDSDGDGVGDLADAFPEDSTRS